MNITILNGNPDWLDQEFDRYLEFYRIKMHHTGHYVKSFMLREMKINDFRSAGSQPDTDTDHSVDDFRYIANCLGETDLLIIASPLEQGYISVLTKMILDRLTRVLQPPDHDAAIAWTGEQGGSRKVPLMGIIMQKETDTSEKDLLFNRLTSERIAANIHTVLDFCITMDSGVTEAVCKTFQSIDYHSYIEKTYTDLIEGSAYKG